METGIQLMIYGTVDGVFRSIMDSGWTVNAAGHMSFPQGYFALVCIPRHEGERRVLRDAVYTEGDAEIEVYDTIEPGWYFVVQNSDGNINHKRYDDSNMAIALFANAKQAYDEWAINGE